MKLRKTLLIPAFLTAMGVGSRCLGQNPRNPLRDFPVISYDSKIWKNFPEGERFDFPEKGGVIIERFRGDVLDPEDTKKILRAVKEGHNLYVFECFFGFADTLTKYMDRRERRRLKSYVLPYSTKHNFSKDEDKEKWWRLKPNPITKGMKDVNVFMTMIYNPRKNIKPILQTRQGVVMGVVPYGKGEILFDGTDLYQGRYIETEKGNKILQNIARFLDGKRIIESTNIYELLGLEGKIIGQYMFEPPWPNFKDLRGIKNAMIIEENIKSGPRGKKYYWYNIDFVTIRPDDVREKFHNTEFYIGMNEGMMHFAFPDSVILKTPQKIEVSFRKDGKWIYADRISQADIEKREETINWFGKGLTEIIKKSKLTKKNLLAKIIGLYDIDKRERGFRENIKDDALRGFFKKYPEMHIHFNIGDIKIPEDVNPDVISFSFRTKKQVLIGGVYGEFWRSAIMRDLCEEGKFLSKPVLQKVTAPFFIGTDKEIDEFFEKFNGEYTRPHS